MNINVGPKWGALLAAGLGALGVAITDGVLDTPDLVTVLVATLGAVGAGYAGVRAFKSDSSQGRDTDA